MRTIQNVTLVMLQEEDREQFILDNQEAFRYGAMEEFGMVDDHYEEDDEIISRKTIEDTMDASNAEIYRIVCDGKVVGGVMLNVDRINGKGELDLLFVSPSFHNRGIGYAAWQIVERMFPEIHLWETDTPYYEKRNIHFYVNRCGFQIVEFFCSHHKDPNCPHDEEEMFHFEKHIFAHNFS